MLILKKKTFRGLLMALLVLLSWGAKAQVAVNSVVAQTPVSFASTDFQMDLTITINLVGATTSADVEVALHNGIEYVAGSAQNVSGVTNIVEKTGSTPNKPIFTITGAAGSTVTFKIKRKVTKAAVPQIKAGIIFIDKVKAKAGGHTTPETSANYKLDWPSLQILPLAGQTNAPIGVATQTITIKNNASVAGSTKDIYFSIVYPTGVSPVTVTAPTGYTLTKIAASGKELYKLSKTSGVFAGGESVSLTESYKVERCNKTFSINYVVFWGTSATDSYEDSTPVIRSVSSGEVITTIIQKNDAVNDRYFEWKNGLCGPVVGTTYFSFKNNSADGSTAYNNKLLLSIANGNFSPDNVYIIATDNTKISVPLVYENNNYYLKFEQISLSTFGGKNVGLTDEDNDGFADDLKANAIVRICFDIKNNIARPYTCASKNVSFTINPLGVNTWEDSCGTAKEVRYNTGDILREFTVTDGSSIPIQLVKNQPNEGYFLPLYGAISSSQIPKGQSSGQNNPIKYRYYAKLPQGVAMKNIRFYYTQDPTETTAPFTTITNVAAGGVLDFTFDPAASYPAGVDANFKTYRKPGYIAYELELTDCTGVGTTGNLDFQFYVLDKNGNNTWCEIPRICNTYSISMGCPTATCSAKGPQMLSTKVERADDSYGWTTVSMTTRVSRSAVSAKQRRRALYLDNLEFISEGRQTTEQNTDNLYYYMAAVKTANLKPKFVKVTIGGNETTLQATDAGVVTQVTDANGNYFRWNLTDALPGGLLAAGQTFSVVATYQVNANDENSATEVQSGKTSYFYTLANKADTAVNAQGVHNNELHCGVDLIPVFSIVNTYTKFASNHYSLTGCNEVAIGGYMIFSGRTTVATDYFTDEYRPGKLIDKITLKFPLAYRITQPVRYEYNATVADVAKNYGSKPQVLIPLNKWVMTIEGDRRVYTYTNPTNTSDPFYLPPGMIMARSNYAEFIRPLVQASCDAKDYTTYTGTNTQKEARLRAEGETAQPEVVFEDYYYHYAQTAEKELATKAFNNPLWYSGAPVLKMTPEGAGLGITAIKPQQEALFSLSALVAPTPYTWVSIPDVAGIQVDALEEVTSGGAFVRTVTHQTSISGEKMYFLGQTIAVGAANQKYYRVKFTITNCNVTQQKLKVYAGWNCGSNPTGGYQQTCGKNFLEYTVQIVESKKQITALGTNTNTIQMCAPTNFGYEIKSAGIGNIADAKLVIVQHTGITIDNVKIEYPLGSGTVYNTATLVNNKKIGVQTVGNKTIYELSDILPDGVLLGGLLSTTTEAQKTFKLTFDVSPNCDFTAGSSFDIDIDGKDFCGGQAKGDKTTAIIANIAGVNITNYTTIITNLAYASGNANACDATGALYTTRVMVNSTVPAYQVGANARLRFRIPEGYELVGTWTGTRTVDPSWVDPVRIPTEDSDVGTEREIVVKLPQGMKNNQFFDYGVYIRQKADVLIACSTLKNLKVLATDEVHNIPCPSLGHNCPKIVAVTSSGQQTVPIKNDRADLSITEVKATAVPSANKENLTIEYKIANAATASATYNGSVVVSLYNDLNNNGLVEASEVLATNTTTQALGAGVTSTVQTFTYLADQAQVCRLRLAIRNIDNKCLCDDKDVALPTPTLGANLVSNLSTCETAPATFTYNAAAPAYDSYTWSPASYLSAANTPTPTFTYSGAKLTAPLTVTYMLTVKRTNGCESTQTVTVVVTPTTVTPAPNAVNLCAGNTIQSLKQYLGGLVSGTLRVYSTATATAELGNTIAITNNTTYYYSAQVAGLCESERRAILVKIVAAPNALSVYTYCTGTKVATLWDTIDPTDSDRSLKIYTVASGGTPLDRNTVLQNRTYYVADSATNGVVTPTCESARVAVTVNITTVATPTVSATTALCPTAGTQSVSFAAYATALSGNSLRWYATATATVPLAVTPTISTQVSSTTTRTVYVSQVTTAGCEGGRAAITLVVKDVTAPTLSAPAPLVTDCRNAAASITTWLGTVTATDSCGTVSLTNNYNAPADFCNVPNGTLTVTFVAKDLFGNTTTQTRTITLVSIKAENDTFTVTHGAVATTTANSVLTNDKVGTQTATTGTVSLSVTIPATGAAGSATPTLNSNGTITVPAGTKSGTYQIGYRICTTVATLTVCDTATATVVVGAPAIIANGDTRTVTNGVVGGTVSSVLTNDSYNGVLNPGSNSVTLTWGTLPAGVVTTTNVGELKVNAGTASGTHQIPYSICDKVNTHNCSTATLTLVIGAPTVIANSDTRTVTNGVVGGTISSVLTNDSYNGVTNPSTNSVTLSWGTLPAGVVTTTNVGELKVNAGTASGTHQIPYTICDKVNTHNCSTATLTLVIGAPGIIANSDTRTVTNGVVGGTVSSVLTNDSYNGVLNPGSNSVTLSWGTLPAGVVTTTTVGELKVNPGTASGTHQIPYTICDKINNHNCSTATLTLVIGAPGIIANSDTRTVTNGVVGGTVSSVLTNDTYNGVTNPSTNSVTLSWGTLPAGVVTTTTVGELKVNAGTASGTHQIPYTICDGVNSATNCSTATLTLVIGAPAIIANGDTRTVTNGVVGGTISSVLTNDSYNGVTNPSTNSVTLSWGTLPAGVVTTTTVGELKVNAGTASGTHQIPYTICDGVNSATNCSTATLTLVIGAPTIVANGDTRTVTDGVVGGTISSVLTNDSYNGVTNPSTNSVTLSWGTLPAGVVTTTTVGELKVNAGTASGTHQIPYTICDGVNSATNCSTATLTLVIGAPAIIANGDTRTVTNGVVGGTVSSVLTNDSYNGVLNPSTNSITLSWGTLPAGVVTTTTVGELKVNAGTASGTHQIPYTICDGVNSATNCSTATLTLVIGAPAIIANSDTRTVTNGVVGGTVSSVLTNDSYNGVLNPSTNSITLSWGTLPAGVVTTTTVGELKVNAGTASGTHQIPYTICDGVNSATNCSTATLTLVIGAPAVTPTITVGGDSYTVTGTITTPTTVGNILTNDSLGGQTPTVASVTIHTATPTSATTPRIDPSTGNVIIPSGTPSGTYTMSYYLCERANSSNCSTPTTVTVTVVGVSTPTVTPTITVGGDSYTVTGTITTPTTVGNILTNDSLGGQTPTVASVTIHTATPTSATTPRIDPSTGNVIIPSGTPSGTYTMSYYLCERANSSNCSTPTTVTVTVVGVSTPTVTPTITVGGDSYTVTGTITTPTTVGNILTNDSLGGQTPTVASVTIHTATPTSATTPRIDPSTGNVIIPSGTPSGTYTMSYYLCERANSSNCSTPTTVTVTVVGVSTPTVTPTITVGGDSYTVTGTITTPTTVGNILTNDSLGGQTPTVASVTIHTATPTSATTPRIDPSTGNVIIPSGTPSGTYTMSYYLCERANSSNCSTPTTVTVTVVGVSTPTVTPTTIEANGDTFVRNGVPTSTTTLGNILTNDKLNGNLNPAVQSVTITTPSTPAHTPYIHPGTGEVIVPPHTPVGVYELPYTICALASPTICDTATAVVTVNSIEAHNDGRHLLGTTVGGTISSVLANDKLNGRTPAASEVTINWQAAPAGFTYNTDGSITVAAGTAVGTYTISYTLCATATPTLCSEPAEVVVEVTAATPVPPLSITAVYDGVYYIEKGTATTLTSVLANDLLDSDPATTGNVSLTWDISAPAGFTLNADGTAHVATNTAVGRYEIPYTICAKNGTLCSTTKLVVTVLAPTVTPTIEVNGETFTYTGNPTVGNVLTNEKLNGTPNPSVRSVTISIMPPPPGAYEPYLDPSTGDVIVPPHTPAGNYTVTYRVCTIDTPVACGVAQVTVVIPATPTPTVAPIAADDKVETARNTPITINVLANDTPNGATTPNVVTTPLNGTAVVNPDGTIEYTPNTGFVGTDRLVYTLCNAGGCATATVNIEVTNKLIVYNGISVNGSDKNNHFHIAGIEAYPDNTVRIYNRWGVKVWEVQSYDNVRNVFKGISNGRVTVEAADKLPQGTYYYIIEYVDENNQKQTMVGWLYLKKD
ncbi:T9SS type B sorting domain-containing protein [Capnocytophaga leadbetteri]